MSASYSDCYACSSTFLSSTTSLLLIVVAPDDLFWGHSLDICTELGVRSLHMNFQCRLRTRRYSIYVAFLYWNSRSTVTWYACCEDHVLKLQPIGITPTGHHAIYSLIYKKFQFDMMNFENVGINCMTLVVSREPHAPIIYTWLMWVAKRDQSSSCLLS